MKRRALCFALFFVTGGHMKGIYFVNDRVCARVNGGQWVPATIVAIMDEHLRPIERAYSICTDTYSRYLHSCDGLVPVGHGWNCFPVEIKLLHPSENRQ